MRALLLVHNLPERGSWFRALEIARRLARRGHFVQLGYTSPTRKYRPVYRLMDLSAQSIEQPGAVSQMSRSPLEGNSAGAGGELVWAECPNWTFFTETQEGWSLFDNAVRARDALSGKWDLIYGFSHKPNCVIPGLAGRLRGAKTVLDWSDWWGGAEGLYQLCVLPSNRHQSMPRPWRLVRQTVFAAESFWEPRVYKLPDAVTLISEEFFNHPAAPADLRSKSLVLHSGSPLEDIRPRPRAESRRRLGYEFPENAIVLGYVANFHLDERLLLEAFARVCDVRSDVYLLVAGADFDQSDPDLHRRTLGRIFHAGRRPFSEIPDFLGAADLLVLPLSDVAIDRARYPHKLSDYVAAGRPIIACDVGETGRLLRRFKFGQLTPPTPDGLAEGIFQMLERRLEWPALGAQTRDAAEIHFSWDGLCDTLFAFLADRLRLQI